jgi:LPS-assembly lipoprotein
MSLYNRRTLLMLPLAMAACGFTPVYGPDGNGNALYGKIEVQAPDDVESYVLVQNLEQRLGRSTSPEYTLALTARTRSEGQAITASNEITRFSLVGQAEYVLTRNSDQFVLAEGSVDNFTGYSATGSTVETLAGERDARQRLMGILADQISAQIYATADPGT